MIRFPDILARSTCLRSNVAFAEHIGLSDLYRDIFIEYHCKMRNIDQCDNFFTIAQYNSHVAQVEKTIMTAFYRYGKDIYSESEIESIQDTIKKLT